MINKERHPVDIYVGQRLRQKRQELGVSQEKLGEAVNLTFQQIQKYEKGFNRISCSKLFEFSSYLKININYFFEGYNNENITYNYSYSYIKPLENNNIIGLGLSDLNLPNDEISKELATLVELYNKIKSKEARQQIIEFARSISETT